MPFQTTSRGHPPDDGHRTAVANGLVEILIGTAAPRLVQPLPRWEDIVSAAARPGTGGRRKRLDVGFEIEATRELRERYGQPDEITHRGSLLLVWEMDRAGDGIVAGRLSSQDVQKGETAMAQIHNGISLARDHSLKPAFAIVAMRTSGGAAYEHRIDFSFIRDRIAACALRWVCYREPDRIARELHPAYSFFKHLEETDTDLYLCSLGRKVDWNSQSDKLMIGTLSVISEFERGAIKARTHNAIRTRFLETGRGYPGLIRIGFRRNAQMYTEQDLEQWPYVLQAHEMYSRLKSDGGTSIRGLQAFLTDKLGFKISRERVRKMLKDPLYVTGMTHAKYDGIVYPLRPVELVNPVPIQTFEHNQLLMAAVKGRQRKNPLGHFLLNRIDFRHELCENHIAENGRPVLLRAENKSYIHDGRCPLPECRGFAVPHKEVDAAITAELLRLCEDPELQRSYQQRARMDLQDTTTGVLTPGQQRSQQARITDLTRQREEIVRTWISEGTTTHDLNPRYLQEAVEHIDAEVARLERQLDLSKRLKAAQKHAPPEDRASLLERARQILTPEPPDDPELRQRRLIFVQQALSKVIARRTRHGFELELFGPLIPADAVPLHFDPLSHAQAAIARGTDPQGLTWKSVPRWRDGCGPVWRSAPIRVRPVLRLRVGPAVASVEDVRRAISTISAEAGPGPIRAVVVRGVCPRREGLASREQVMRCVAAHRLSWDGEARAVLGVEVALRMRRVAPRSVSDWRLLIGWAIEEGLSFESGWAVRWNELNVRVGWLGSHRRVVVAQRALGFSLALLAAEELEQRGLPAVRPGRRPGRGRDSSLEACAERLREAAAVAAPGRLTWPKITDALPNGSRSLTASQIYHALYRLGITKETALRTALGRREALVSGRVVARTRGEWVTVMSAAIADGYTPGRGWVSRWKDLRARHPRYVSIRTLLVGAETCGGIEELYAAAIRGARPHVAPEPGSG